MAALPSMRYSTWHPSYPVRATLREVRRVPISGAVDQEADRAWLPARFVDTSADPRAVQRERQ